MEEELARGRRLQRSFVSLTPPDVPGYDIAAHYEAAREVGGDFFDLFRLRRRGRPLSVVIADVTGKGIAAALLMAFVRPLLHAAIDHTTGPADALERTNRILVDERRSSLFITALAGRLDLRTGHLRLANRPPPLIIRADGSPPTWLRAGPGRRVPPARCPRDHGRPRAGRPGAALHRRDHRCARPPAIGSTSGACSRPSRRPGANRAGADHRARRHGLRVPGAIPAGRRHHDRGDPAAARGVTTVLDGGLATELEARGHDLSDRLWSARLLLSEPDAIEEVHLAYFAARVAITASYQASVEGFAAAASTGDGARGDPAQRRARAARAAVPRRRGGRGPRSGACSSRDRWVYGAMLADGSEYRGDDPGDAALERSTGRGSMHSSRPARTCSPSRRSRPSARRACSSGCSRDRRPGLDLVHRPRRRRRGEAVRRGDRRGWVRARCRRGGRQLHRPGTCARCSRSRGAQPSARCLPEPGDTWDPGRAPGAATRPGRGNPPSASWTALGAAGSAAVAAPDRPTSSDWPRRWQRRVRLRSTAG